MLRELFQIQAPYFTAGFCVDAKNIVWKAAPIIRWLEDKPYSFVVDYCKKKGWRLLSVSSSDGQA